MLDVFQEDKKEKNAALGRFRRSRVKNFLRHSTMSGGFYVLWLFKLEKLMNHFLKVKSNPGAVLGG